MAETKHEVLGVPVKASLPECCVEGLPRLLVLGWLTLVNAVADMSGRRGRWRGLGSGCLRSLEGMVPGLGCVHPGSFVG